MKKQRNQGCRNFFIIIFISLLCFNLPVSADKYIREDQKEQMSYLSRICDSKSKDFNSKKCYEEAENSAIKGEFAGKLIFAEILKLGVCGKIDLKKSFFWYNEALKEGSIEAMSSLAVFYLQGEIVKPDYKKAFEYTKEAAEYGMTRSMLHLGDMYLNGLEGFVEKDVDKAIKWYEKAKDSGDSYGYLKLAGIYFSDRHVPHDWKKCVTYREKAVEMGNTYALLTLGFLYEVGACGKKIDLNKAARLYFDGIVASKGTDFDSIYAYSALVVKKYDPELDKEAIERGYKYLEYIAKRGHESAQKLLIECYRHGVGGIGKQEIKAKYWEEIYRNNPNLAFKNK